MTYTESGSPIGFASGALCVDLKRPAGLSPPAIESETPMTSSVTPPWPPTMDGEADTYGRQLETEKYDGHVDDEGWVRWGSEWRMHRGNGMNALDATVAVFESIDAIRAGQEPAPHPGPYQIPWLPEYGAEAPAFIAELRGLYAEQNPASTPEDPIEVDYIGYVRWSSDWRIHRARGLAADAAWSRVETDILNIWGVAPFAKTEDPIQGQLTTDGDRCFCDAVGPRVVCVYHGGDLFALFCAGKVDTVREVLADVALAGYHIVRSWVCLNDALDPGNVWVGPDYVGVGPTHTADYTGQLIAFALLLDSFGLKWHMAAGGIDGMDTAQEENMFTQWADAMDGAGPDKWALVEALNEARDTGDGDGDNTPEHLEDLINIVRTRHPGVLYTLTSYTGTEDPALLGPYQPDWVQFTYYHGYRGGEIDDKIRHRISMALESGLGRLFWDGEPGGAWNAQGIPGDPLTSVSAQDNDHEYDDESVAAMHVGTVIAHGIPAFMSSTGVRHYISPYTFPGFASTPRLLRLLPDDTHTGETVHGGRSNSPIEATTNDDGFIGRADSSLLPDGRFVSVLYGERPGRYDFRLRQGIAGDLINPADGTATPIDIPAGETLTIEMNWARVFVGRVHDAQLMAYQVSYMDLIVERLRARVEKLERAVRELRARP